MPTPTILSQRNDAMSIRFVALETPLVESLQKGEADANGQTPERQVSDGAGVPCRHCLHPVGQGETYLILAHRPFPKPQPYAELGPIFLHAESCPRHVDNGAVPDMLYGSGQIVPTPEIPRAAAQMFDDSRISYVHVRSASNNCYQCRIDRA
jgi:hypothetical protein